MNLGFIKIFALFVVVLVIGVFAFLTLAEVPVQQTELVVPISDSLPAPAATTTPAQTTTTAPVATPEMATPAPAAAPATAPAE